MRYKIGDKVIIKNIEELREKHYNDGEYFYSNDGSSSDVMNGNMLLFCGKIVVITGTNNKDRYRIQQDGGMWAWADWMFEGKIAERIERVRHKK
jgi:phosphatidylserine/phosphatidylglycerophosphate/cardiolipin synthase-like enzyme